MFCKFCGSEIANDSAVCPSCGKDIAGAVPEEPESARDDSVWYYQNDAEMDGPYTYDMLKEKILSGSIPLEARVKQEPGGSWTALCDSPFREAALKKTPAPVAISDKWLWCLAILPLLATTVSAFLGAGAFKGLFGDQGVAVFFPVVGGAAGGAVQDFPYGCQFFSHAQSTTVP